MEKHRTHPQEDGSALVWAILFTVIVFGMIMSHSVYTSAHRAEMDVRYQRSSLAGTFARSGTVDAHSWFQGQTEQPVRAFQPALDAAAVPPVLDTLEPDLGLVREFEIRGNLWGRYEVRRDEVQDVSAQRGSDNPGSVWEIGARGIVYRRVDPDRAFDEAPNRVITKSVIRTEMRGMTLSLPAPAAVNVASPSQVFVESNGAVDGAGHPAFAYSATKASDAPNPAAGIITGVPASLGVAGFDLSSQHVFAMRMEALRDFSDSVLPGGGTVPETIRQDKIVYVDGDMQLGAGHKLRANNVLIVVKGNFEAAAGNDAKITGMVYVAGNATVRGPFSLQGTLVVGGDLVLGGSASPAKISYDQEAMSRLARSMARYRLSRSRRPGVGPVQPVGDAGADVDPTASVRAEARYGDYFVVGAGTKVWGPVVIGDNVRIGDNCWITQGLSGTPVIGNNVRIGDDVRIIGGAQVLDNAVVPAGTWLTGGDVFGDTAGK